MTVERVRFFQRFHIRVHRLSGCSQRRSAVDHHWARNVPLRSESHESDTQRRIRGESAAANTVGRYLGHVAVLARRRRPHTVRHGRGPLRAVAVLQAFGTRGRRRRTHVGCESLRGRDRGLHVLGQNGRRNNGTLQGEGCRSLWMAVLASVPLESGQTLEVSHSRGRRATAVGQLR